MRMSAQDVAKSNVNSSTSSSDAHPKSLLLQRKNGAKDCDKGKEQESLQKKALSPKISSEVPHVVYEVLNSSGQPLNSETRAFMENRFGHNFSQVRVHTDSKAAESARSVQAHAYTLGNDVVFREGHYSPGTASGKFLISHELAHVTQQENEFGKDSHFSGADVLNISSPGDALEAEADTQAKNVLAGKPVHLSPGKNVINRIMRQSTVSGKNSTETDPFKEVEHDHQPTGRWKEVQANAKAKCSILSKSGGIECACSTLTPLEIFILARDFYMVGSPLAKRHINHYLLGGGAEFKEDLEDVIKRDEGVRNVIERALKSVGNSGFVTIQQSDYAVEDFSLSFGTIDKLNYETDPASGKIHLWFKDKYEWHPAGFGHEELADDIPRDTNCVHAAMVELKSLGAADYWMTGNTVVPLSLFKSAPSNGIRSEIKKEEMKKSL